MRSVNAAPFLAVIVGRWHRLMRLPSFALRTAITENVAPRGSEVRRACPPPANSFGNVMQSLSAKPYAGKHFIYRAAVRVEAGGPADTAMLWFRVDLPNQGIGFFDNMRDRPIRSGDWAVYEIKGDVDPDAT